MLVLWKMCLITHFSLQAVLYVCPSDHCSHREVIKWLKSGVLPRQCRVCMSHMCCAYTGNYTFRRFWDSAVWCMFACKDYKEVRKGHLGLSSVSQSVLCPPYTVLIQFNFFFNRSYKFYHMTTCTALSWCVCCSCPHLFLKRLQVQTYSVG